MKKCYTISKISGRTFNSVGGDYNNMCGPLLMNSNLVISGIVYPWLVKNKFLYQIVYEFRINNINIGF